MLENLFKSWSLICFGIQQHVYNILDLCFKKKKQIIIDLNQIFTGNALKITALSLRTLRVAISWSRKEKFETRRILPWVISMAGFDLNSVNGAISFVSRQSFPEIILS